MKTIQQKTEFQDSLFLLPTTQLTLVGLSCRNPRPTSPLSGVNLDGSLMILL